MEELKFECMFNGKVYPLICCTAIPLAAGILLHFLKLPDLLTFFIMLFCFLIAFAVCYAIEHRLTDEEKQKIEASDSPLWQNVPPELAEQLRQSTQKSSLLIPCLAGAALLSCILLLISGASTPAVVMIGIIGVLIVLYWLNTQRSTGAWLETDESAVYITVPVDHMLKTKKNENGTYTGYPVCYLPTGKVVLKSASLPSEDLKAIHIIKFRGSVRWIPADSDSSSAEEPPSHRKE